MRAPAQIRLLPDGRRLHLRDGPIDLIVEAFGTLSAVEAAYQAAVERFRTILDELCTQLSRLRASVSPLHKDATAGTHPILAPLRRRPCEEGEGTIARNMRAAVKPFAAAHFITPMAAVAGAVADEVLRVMTATAELDRAYVNNGGDIALHLAGDAQFRIGMIDRPDRPGLFGHVALSARDAVRGVATSGRRGRSFSLGIADAVTVLAASAAQADAAATMIANAVDLPGHPGIGRVPASSLQPDSDLGTRLVTRSVAPLSHRDVDTALAAGVARGEEVRRRGLIVGAALHLQGMTRIVGDMPSGLETRDDVDARVGALAAGAIEGKVGVR